METFGVGVLKIFSNQNLMQWFFQVLKLKNQFNKHFLWLFICGSVDWIIDLMVVEHENEGFGSDN